MKHNDLINAGFKLVDDPQFKYEFKIELSDNEGHEYLETNPALLFDNENGRFCLYEGHNFIYLNTQDPLKAIEWINQISHFEPN